MRFNERNIRRARQEKGLTLEEAAKKLNMDITAFWRLENGRTKVKAEQLPAIMELFDKPYSYFFERQDEPIDLLILMLEDQTDKMLTAYNLLKSHPELLKYGQDDLLRIKEDLEKRGCF